MKIKKIKINKFKRFTNLEIKEIPKKTKLVIMVGPNGSGKSSVFEAFNHWYKLHGYGKAIANEKEYYEKKSDIVDGKYWYQNKVDIDFHEVVDKGENLKGKFYFRTAYRNQPDFTVSRLESQKNPTEEIKLSTLMMNDVTVSENYQRLIAQTLEGVYKEENNSKDIKTFREELVGKIQESLSNIFDDLKLNSIGNPLSNGSFYWL
jgi:predicted ATP-dependent endonuclease of OLD family